MKKVFKNFWIFFNVSEFLVSYLDLLGLLNFTGLCFLQAFYKLYGDSAKFIILGASIRKLGKLKMNYNFY